LSDKAFETLRKANGWIFSAPPRADSKIRKKCSKQTTFIPAEYDCLAVDTDGRCAVSNLMAPARHPRAGAMFLA
jgi:hypothetical protein